MSEASVAARDRQANALGLALVFTVVTVMAAVIWLLYSYRQVLKMEEQYAGLKDSVIIAKGGRPQRPVRNAAVITPVQPNTPKVSPQPQIENNATAILPKKDTTRQPMAAAQPKPIAQKPAITAAKPVEKNPPAKTEPVVASRNVVLTYYVRKADNESLERALKGLGYRFEHKELDKNTGYQKSNCVYFGAGVPLADVKRVAIAMIQSGTTVKGIKRFGPSYKNAAYKRNVIEIGMEQALENYYSKPLSVVEVQRARSFK